MQSKTVWCSEVYVDPANVSKSRQDVAFKLTEVVFTDEISARPQNTQTSSSPSNSSSEQQKN